MAETPNTNKKAPILDLDDEDAVQAAKDAAEAELPPPGYERDELLKKREASLQQQIDQVSSQIMRGTVDASKLEIINEIANQTKYLSVSNADPNYVYGWVSKNRNGQHLQAVKRLGWQVVQGDMPEAAELKGTTRTQAGGEPDTTRQLGDVILVRIPKERYIVLKAQELAHTRRVQQASASNLLDMGHAYRDRGIIVRPFGMDTNDHELAGPEIRPRMFSSRQQALKEIERRLKDGSVPGMEINH